MRKSKFKWQAFEEVELPSAYTEELKTYKIDENVGRLLFQRGIHSQEALAKFFQPKIEDLHDPFLLHDMQKAVDRIHLAIEQGEKILIYGDYDADGITSTTVLLEALEEIGAEVLYYLPNRFEDGYGPNEKVYKYYIEQENVQLILTVDNGIAGHSPIEYAMSKGVDVVVTDHHELPEILPNAFAIVHTKHPESKYPFKELAGVGVAFKLACAVLKDVPLESLDLVALGTIADMVSLTDENRLLVQLGLEQMSMRTRLGLDELIQVCGIKTSKITEVDVGFQIAPRLNALGRLKDAKNGVELMHTFDEEEAKELAKEIDETNIQRKAIVEEIAAEALEEIQKLPEMNAYVLAKEGWHEGVLGIVAGRIMEMFGKPVVILTITKEGQAKGSARSVDVVNIYDCLSEMKELFLAFGGHHAAAGMTLLAENIEKLREGMNEYIDKKKIDVSQANKLCVDEELLFKDASIEMIEQVEKLSPFGKNFPRPVFVFEKVTTSDTRQIGADKSHLKLKLSQGENAIGAIFFSGGQWINEMTLGPSHSFVGTLEINEWNGRRLPQLVVKDFQIAGNQYFDARGKNGRQILPQKDVLYLFFAEENKKLFQDLEEEKKCLFSEIEQFPEKQVNSIVFADLPENLKDLKAVYAQVKATRFYFLFYKKEEVYIEGVGSREQFAKLYRFIKEFDEVDLRNKFLQMANYLKMPPNLFIYMMKVFEELAFVKIQDGIMRVNTNSEKKSIESSKIYLARKEKMKCQEFLMLSDMRQLEEFLTAEKNERN